MSRGMDQLEKKIDDLEREIKALNRESFEWGFLTVIAASATLLWVFSL